MDVHCVKTAFKMMIAQKGASLRGGRFWGPLVGRRKFCGEGNGRELESYDHSTDLTFCNTSIGGLEIFLGQGNLKPGEEPMRS